MRKLAAHGAGWRRTRVARHEDRSCERNEELACARSEEWAAPMVKNALRA